MKTTCSLGCIGGILESNFKPGHPICSLAQSCSRGFCPRILSNLLATTSISKGKSNSKDHASESMQVAAIQSIYAGVEGAGSYLLQLRMLLHDIVASLISIRVLRGFPGKLMQSHPMMHTACITANLYDHAAIKLILIIMPDILNVMHNIVTTLRRWFIYMEG